jgi:hypothetical protein
LNAPLPRDDLKKFLALNMILTDLEHYLMTEIREWTQIAMASTSKEEAANIVMHALLDIKKELNRLKKVYLTKT